LRETQTHPTPANRLTVRQVFNRFGAEEWDARRTQFRVPAVPAKAAE
jgi:sulfur relay (sulfurtransferase) DsrC/TusE family protein